MEARDLYLKYTAPNGVVEIASKEDYERARTGK